MSKLPRWTLRTFSGLPKGALGSPWGLGDRGAGGAIVVGSLLGSLAGCPGTQAPEGGCHKDTDCKGNRICVSGLCSEPGKDGVEAAAEAAPKPRTGAGTKWFRGGPGHAGASEFLGPTEAPKLRWEMDLGSVIFATPTVAPDANGDPVAYVGTHSGRFVGVVVSGERAGQLALDLDLGGRVWGTAAVGEDGTLYVGTDDDKLYAIDPAQAKVTWSLPLGSCQPTRAPGPEGARCDVDGGPTIGPDGDLYVGADGVYRVSPAGEIKWHWPTDDAKAKAEAAATDGGGKPEKSKKAPVEGKHVFSTPLVTDDGKIYFGGQDGYVTSLSHDGLERWRYRVGKGTDVDGSPGWDEDGGIFVGTDDGRVLALRSDGSLRWSFLAQKDVRSSVGVGPNGSLYVTSFDRNLYALSPSGEVQWVLPTGGIVHSSPVVDAAGTIFFGSQDDHLYAVSPEGKVLWSQELPGDVDSSVAIAPDGAVIVGCDDGRLRAYAVP